MTKIAVAVLIFKAIFIGVFSKILPNKPKRHISDIELNLKKWKYHILNFIFIIPYFLFIGAIIYLFYKIGGSLEIELTNTSDNTLFKYSRPLAFWFLPGCLFGFSFGGYLVMGLFRVILGKMEFEKFVEFGNRMYGIDGKKLWRYLSMFLIFLGIISLYLWDGWKFEITKDGNVEIDEYFSLKKRTYELNDIEGLYHYKLTKAPNGNLLHKPYYVINFKDGFIWSTDNGLKEEYNLNKAVFDHLSTKIGKGISYQDVASE